MSSRTKKRRETKHHHRWSKWEYHDDYHTFVRSRQNDDFPGGYEWQYNPSPETATGDIPEQSQSASEVPRYTPPANDQLQATRQTSYSPPESYTYESDRPDDDDSIRTLTSDFASTGLSDASGKGKQPATWQPDASSPSFSRGQSQTYSQNPRTHQSQGYYASNQRYSQAPAQLGYIQENEQSTAVEPFANQLDSAAYQKAGLYDTFAATSYSANYNPSQYIGYGQGSSQTTDPAFISGSNDGEVDLHPDFKLHYSKEFKFMKVFKMVWHETRGDNNTFGTDTIYGKFKQPVNASVRRFIILKADKGHCLCLPILTYNQQGTTKRGLIVEHHGIIYTSKHAPALQPNEQPLTKPAVRMKPHKQKHDLHPASRINYAKIYTVEHNVKCVFIGEIDKSHEQRVLDEYNKTLQV